MTNIKIENIKEGETISKSAQSSIIISSLPPSDPYLRIMMFSQSGRLIKKKKTTVKVGTKDPVFNETLNFEVNMSFNFQAFLSLFRLLQAI
jgi:hypothetical protein